MLNVKEKLNMSPSQLKFNLKLIFSSCLSLVLRVKVFVTSKFIIKLATLICFKVSTGNKSQHITSETLFMVASFVRAAWLFLN